MPVFGGVIRRCLKSGWSVITKCLAAIAELFVKRSVEYKLLLGTGQPGFVRVADHTSIAIDGAGLARYYPLEEVWVLPSELASIASAVSGLAATVSLIYVGIQIRLSVRHTMALIQQGTVAEPQTFCSDS